ncbi:MAG: alpha/beta hydrolase [Nevskia sp.]|nr:alpha/beta hydrolase [Nevskia sp.]
MTQHQFKQGTVQANGLRFHYLEAGSGPLALCLHGFPDSPYSYRHLLPELARAGFRAVAPFMRGYAPTGIPADGRYATRDLAADVAALHAALGGGADAVLIAHDWGAVAAYGGAAKEPERWRRCAIMDVPPLAIFAEVGSTYAQVKRSFYFWFFQMKVADEMVAANNMEFIDRLWGDWSPGYAAAEDLVHVKNCLRERANLMAALGYYRTHMNPLRYGAPDWAAEQVAVWGAPLKQPTLYLHGDEDGCIALDDALLAKVPNFLGPGSRAERVQGVGHFMLVQKPAEVNRRILEFVGGA